MATDSTCWAAMTCLRTSDTRSQTPCCSSTFSSKTTATCPGVRGCAAGTAIPYSLVIQASSGEVEQKRQVRTSIIVPWHARRRDSVTPGGARVGPFVGKTERNGSDYTVGVMLDRGQEAKTVILANELRKDRKGQRV